jgi:hypothetical protein
VPNFGHEDVSGHGFQPFRKRLNKNVSTLPQAGAQRIKGSYEP